MDNEKRNVMAALLGGAVLLLLLIAGTSFFGMNDKELPRKSESTTGAAVQEAAGTSQGGILAQPTVTELPIYEAAGKTLSKRINPPAGYTRTQEEKGSLAEFLRNYPLKKDGSPVLLYNGEKKDNQDAHMAVFKLPLENEDLQQCADSVMRVYAEYFWKTKQYEKISFRFVSGFQADYSRWREGARIQMGANDAYWTEGGTPDESYESFQKYMRIVFAYSSTISLEKESKKIKPAKIMLGDIFIQAGSPGHVVMVVDVCENADGQRAFLLGQGYMPAQEFHLLKNPAHEDDPWYYADELTYPLQTPEYSFDKGSLRRPQYGQ